MISQVPQVGPYQQFSSPPRQLFQNTQMPGAFPLAQTIQPQPQFIAQQQMYQGGIPFQNSFQQPPVQMAPPQQFQQQPVQAMSPQKLMQEEPKKEVKKGWWNCFSYEAEPEHKKKKIVAPPQQMSPKLPPPQIQQPMQQPFEYQQQPQFIQYPQFQQQQMPFQPMMMSNAGGMQYIPGQPLQYQQMQQMPMQQQQYQYEEYSVEKKKKNKHGKSKDKNSEKKEKKDK